MIEKPREECGVFGIYSPSNTSDVVSCAFYALYALQHRGQESCGIAVCDDGVIRSFCDNGLVSDVFTPKALSALGGGNMAIGHVRYGTRTNGGRQNASDNGYAHKGQYGNRQQRRAYKPRRASRRA
jgi:amidophosphoribosyltransferase